MINSTETDFHFNKLLIIALLFTGLIAVSQFLQNAQFQLLIYLAALALPFIYLLLFKVHILVFIVVFTIPLSVKLSPGAGVAVSFPAEILTGIIAVFYLIYRLLSPVRLNYKFFRHPITILVMMDMGWLIISTLFSELPIISIKRIIVRFAFMIVFFLVFSILFTDFKNIARVWFIYGLGLLIPIFSTLYNHSQFHFVKAVSFMMTKPFYNDHTQYSTCIAYVFPVLAVIFAIPEKYGFKKNARIFIFFLMLVLSAGELFSFSRAAWLSIVIANLFVGMVVFFRFRLVRFMLITILAGGIIFHFRTDILDYIEKVDAVSRSADTEEHLQSVMNIETDASNLERINRWQCALRMFRDKPLIGFGPGTYQFIYGKYQISPEMTRISTNTGDRGNAHSEYLTYLSETGLPGFIIFNLLILVAINTAIRIFRKSRKKEVKWLTLAILTGFVTYFFHGLFNSFLDTDKASVLVYGSLAALVVIDIYHKDQATEGEINDSTNPVN